MGGEPLRLVARLHPDVALTLRETPLSKDQTLGDESEESVRLEATVADTLELRGWIRSYGSAVEVLSPRTLRAEIAEESRATTKRYRSGGRKSAAVGRR